MRLDLEFGTYRWRKAVFLATAIPAAMLSGWAGYRYMEATRTYDAKLTELRRLAEAQRATEEEDSKFQAAQSDPHAEANAAMDAAIAVPWPVLFAELASAMNKDVALLSLEPDVAKRHVKLSAEARDEKAMTQFVQRLNATKALREAHLTSHRVYVDDPLRPIRFEVSGKWLLDGGQNGNERVADTR